LIERRDYFYARLVDYLRDELADLNRQGYMLAKRFSAVMLVTTRAGIQFAATL